MLTIPHFITSTDVYVREGWRESEKEGRRRETKEEEMRREERKRSERVLGNHERVEQGERKIEEDNKGSCERSEGERGELKIQNTC